MTKQEFLGLNINERADTVWNTGEFIGVRSYYGYKVQLYLLEKMFVEVWYFVESNKIEKIDIQEDTRILAQSVDTSILKKLL